MASRRLARPLLVRAALAALLIGAAPARALDPPRTALDSPSEGRVRVTLSGSGGADGYNVYRDGTYRTTVRPGAGAGAFEFDGPSGTYCIVAFRDSEGSAEYSTCGPSVRVDTGGADVRARPANADGPGPVRELRAARYSDTAGELLWRAPAGAGAAVRYELSRDGRPLGIVGGRSRFESDLGAGRAYDYAVVALGADGRRGAPASVRLGAARGTTNGTVGAPPVSMRSDDGSGASPFAAPGRARLVEGDEAASVELRLTRTDIDRGALRLSLVDETPGASANLEHGFDRSDLDGGGTLVRLRLKLRIAMAPLMPGERRFRVRVEGVGEPSELPLAVDVVPVQADDVYLLIGQSNMQGYSEDGSKRAGPGEPDEPVDRIRQLNVRPSNVTVFDAPWKFTDEAANTSSPRFIRAEDPLHEPRGPAVSRKGGQFVGLGLTFAKSALTRTTRTIYLVPAAWSATGFCANARGPVAWNAWPTPEPALGGTLLTERALTRLNMTLRETGGILRGILWHQGGADSNDATCAARYAENLAQLARRLRGEARVDARGPSARGGDAAVPFIVATQSRGDDGRGRFSDFGPEKRRVDRAHRDVASLIPHADVVNNDDLVPPSYPCGQSSCVHFGAAALREQGYRFDAALRRIVER